jgi:hypothetical protein
MKKYIIDQAGNPMGAGSTKSEATASAAIALGVGAGEIEETIDATAEKIRLGGIGRDEDLFWADEEDSARFEEDGI